MRTGAAGVLVGFGGGRGAHDPHASSASTPRWRPRWPMSPRRAPRLPRRVRRPLRARHRRRRPRHVRRHRQGDRLRRRRGHARLDAGARQPRRPAAAATGAPRRTTPSCRAASAWRSAPVGRSRRSCSARPATADGTVNLIGALRRSMATTGILRPQGVPARRGRRRAYHRSRRAEAGAEPRLPDSAPDPARALDARSARGRGSASRQRSSTSSSSAAASSARARALDAVDPRPRVGMLERATGRPARPAARRSSCTAASATSSSSTSGSCARRSSSAACCCSGIAPHLVKPGAVPLPAQHALSSGSTSAPACCSTTCFSYHRRVRPGRARTHRHLTKRQLRAIAPDSRTDAFVGGISYYDARSTTRATSRPSPAPPPSTARTSRAASRSRDSSRWASASSA